jgi:RNA polymerase sigma-70 factor (ECF subfamily)
VHEGMHTLPASQTLLSTPALDFEGALTRLLPDLRRRARFLTGSGAATEDLIQDTMERALRFRNTFVQGSNLRAWLMRILSNTFISSRRRQTIERRVLEEAAHDPNGWTNLGPSAMKLGLTRALERELDRLPPRIGMTLRLVDLEEASYREAALALDVPVGTVMSRLHRGRTRLAEALGGRGPKPRPASEEEELPTALSA